MMGELANHLWQSTLFAAVAGLVILILRKNRAGIRYGVWIGASIKFLVPFAALASLGSLVISGPTAHGIATQIAIPQVPVIVQRVAQPFPSASSPQSRSSETAVPAATSWIPRSLFVVWLVGFFGIVWVRIKGLRELRKIARASTPLNLGALGGHSKTPIRSCVGLLEPAALGILRPTLLVPEGIMDRLTPEQLQAVLAHEVRHIKRHDNLTAAMHMVVEALFWFHPLVWWIGARLIEEREHACDEEVILRGHEPSVYVEGILNVCKLYKESPLKCAAGVTGANLRRRLESIMANRRAQKLGFARIAILATIVLFALIGPAVGTFPGSARSDVEAASAIAPLGEAVSKGPPTLSAIRSAAGSTDGNNSVLEAKGVVQLDKQTVGVTPSNMAQPQHLMVVSDTTSVAEDGEPAVPYATPYNPRWATSIPGATWVWKTKVITNPRVDETHWFTKTFHIDGRPVAATLQIAADNEFIVAINDRPVTPTFVRDSYLRPESYSVGSLLREGQNTIRVGVTNIGQAGCAFPPPQCNAAGLLYRLDADFVPPPQTERAENSRFQAAREAADRFVQEHEAQFKFQLAFHRLEDRGDEVWVEYTKVFLEPERENPDHLAVAVNKATGKASWRAGE